MEGFDPTVMMAVTALLMPVIGAFMAITPYLMRRGEVFTVTVPTSEQHDPYVVGLKRRYAAIVGSATAVFTVIGFASAAMGNAGGVLGAPDRRVAGGDRRRLRAHAGVPRQDVRIQSQARLDG